MASSNIPDGVPPSDALVEIGAVLRQARTTQDVSLEQAARTVRIRPDFLNNLEAAQLDRLPERVYVRGFIKAYGNYLGLDGEALANRFAAIEPAGDRLQLRNRKPVRIQLRPLHAWMAYVVLIVAAVGGITAFLDRNQAPASRDSALPLPSEPEVAPLEAQSEAPAESLPFQSPRDWTYIAGVFPPPADATATGASSNSMPKGLTVGIEVVEAPSWMRVVADRQTVFEGMLQPGTDREWQASESLAIVAGNAGGVLLSLNDEQLGLMGKAGEVREQSFWLAEDGSVEVR